jgi:hypothetical protein
MYFLNLTTTEFSVLVAAGSCLVVALYLEDRYRREQTVSSLQFWVLLADREGQRGGARIRNVSSLLLQLFCFLALMLALARPEWRSNPAAGKSHVLLLDTSAWTLQSNGEGTILAREKTLALRFISALPAADQVMLTRVDGVVVPLTPFTTNRTLLRQRLSEAEPSLLALNLGEALSFATRANGLSPTREADVVYTGPARIADATIARPEPPNLRTLLVRAKPNHCGIHHVGMERDDHLRSYWTMLVVLRNYGSDACDLLLEAKLSGAALPGKQEHLAPGEDVRAEYRFASTQSESLTITLSPDDGLVGDHRVALQLPALAPIRIAVYTSRPETIQDLVETVPNASVSLRKEDDYRPDAKDADLIILDRISSATPAQVPTLWIAPDRGGSPFPVRSSVASASKVSWNGRTPVAQGLHREDLALPPSNVYELIEGDTAVLSVHAGPVVVVRQAHDGQSKRAVIGFDPANDKVRYEIALPLLLVNLVRWLAAEKVTPTQIAINHAGAGQVDFGEGESLEDVRVSAAAAVPLIAQGRHAQFFAAQPVVVDSFHEGRKERLSMTLPEIAESGWKPSTGESLASPSTAFYLRVDLWRWLVLAALTVILLEWCFFTGAGVGRDREI